MERNELSAILDYSFNLICHGHGNVRNVINSKLASKDQTLFKIF